MSITITCTVCRTSMKIPEGITEPKKVRCFGCSTVILVTPDPSGPGGVSISFPRKKDKRGGLTEAQKRMLLYGLFGAACIFFAYAFWWANRPPENRAAVEGTVTLDGVEMTDGTIRFDSLDGTGPIAIGPISRGRFAISATSGPGFGTYKVTVHSREQTGKKVPDPTRPGEEVDEYADTVAPRFNDPEQDQMKVEIQKGSNVLPPLEYLTK